MDIKKILNSRLKRDIVKFFHENQTAIDTPRGVATWVKEERSRVKDALDDLVQAGILVDHKASSTTGYNYTRNKKTIEEIGRKLKAEE